MHLISLLEYFLFLECPIDINPSRYIPANIRNMIICNMTNDCFGIQCCLDLKFKVPFGNEVATFSLPVGIKMDTCLFEVEASFGQFRHKTSILNYDWGK